MDDLSFAAAYDTKISMRFRVTGREDLQLPNGEAIRPQTMHLTISFTPEYAVSREITAVVSGLFITDGEVVTMMGHRVEVWSWDAEERPDWVTALVEAHLPEAFHV
jgi:hypothetical protein